MSDVVFDITKFPVHLGLGARVEKLEAFDGTPDWYMRYGQSKAEDGLEGRLVSMYTFDASWDAWEMHPNGHELVLCVSGTMTLYQEIDGVTATVVLHAGEAAINPPGAWHTADIEGTATGVFITSGAGTEHRPRT